MKKKVAILLILCMVLASFAACGSTPADSSPSASSAAPSESASTTASPETQEPLTISMVVMGGPKTPNSLIQKKLEEKLNVKLDLIFMPAWEEKNTKLNLLMSDPATMPDVIQWENMDKEFKEWKDAGHIVDILPYLKDNGKEILSYYSKETLFYSYENGKMFKLPGDVAEASSGTILIRGDWLKKLNLEAPKTLEDFKKVAIAFTKQDPDGNNKDDTYGFSGSKRLGSPGIGAFGPIFTAYGIDPDSFMITKDGTIKYGSVLPQMKDALAYLRDLYKEGALDPTMITGNDDKERWSSGKVGIMAHGIHHFNPGSDLNKAFYANNPNAEMVSCGPIQGPDGFASTDTQSVSGWCYLSVTSHAKDPARVVAFLNELCKPENFKLYKFGIEGTHYKIENGLYSPLVSQDQLNADGVNLLCWYLERKDAANIQNTPQVVDMFKKNLELSKPMREIKVDFKDKNRPMWAEYKGDLDTLRDTTVYDIIVGKKDVSAFDKFVEDWYAQGGAEIEKEANELYGRQKEELANFDKQYNDLVK